MGAVESKFSIDDNIIPNPSSEEWNIIMNYYKLPEPILIDCVLTKVVFPDGWKIDRHPLDYKNCHFIIYDANHIEVGYIYMSNNWDGYFGNTTFKKDYIQKYLTNA